MKPEELADELEALSGTVAPWRISSFEVNADATARMVMGGDEFSVAYVSGRSGKENADNAALVVALRNNLPALLSSLRRVAEFEAALRFYADPHERPNEGPWGSDSRDVAAAYLAMQETLHFVFDGPPGPEGPRFVECETPDGRSVNAGDWTERVDGLWELRVSFARQALTGEA